MATDRDALDLLRLAVESAASDLHLKSGMPPMLRCEGALRPVDGRPPLSPTEVSDLVLSLLDDRSRKEWERERELDTSLEIRGLGRFRLNAYVDRAGPGAALRLVPCRIPEPDELGLPPWVGQLVDSRGGLILATGPAGVGKSTTLASLLALALQRSAVHVVTLEDPVEFVLPPGRGLVTQREVGRHTGSFAAALRRALRQDPDLILVGEMRDPETIALALTAAETGHTVLSTLHSPDATGAVDRILGALPPEARAQLAGCLRAVLAQTLLRRQDGRGRVAAREILVGTPAVANLVRENRLHQLYAQIETSREEGMTTLEASLAELVEGGVVRREHALAAARRPEVLAGLLRAHLRAL